MRLEGSQACTLPAMPASMSPTKTIGESCSVSYRVCHMTVARPASSRWPLSHHRLGKDQLLKGSPKVSSPKSRLVHEGSVMTQCFSYRRWARHWLNCHRMKKTGS